jgi:phospholipid/cholesterol/gamma-HCH transport system ATP-binding protein
MTSFPPTQAQGGVVPSLSSTAPQGSAKILLEGVHKSFGPKRVLAGVDLQLFPGESLVVIGGSGTGKSVMIKAILGLIRPDKGRIWVDGQDIMRLSTHRQEKLMRSFGMLFQGAALFDSLKVWENVAFALTQGQGLSRAAARIVAIRKLAAVGLPEDVANLWPSELSGGMQKRVGLARAIATEPDVLFFDEPTTGLDPIMADVINDLIVTSVRQLGAAALTITHDMGSVRKIADRVAMLHNGQIVWQGLVGEIDRTDNPYVQQFVNGRAQGPIKVPVSPLALS